jgi:hypothetical protein
LGLQHLHLMLVRLLLFFRMRIVLPLFVVD